MFIIQSSKMNNAGSENVFRCGGDHLSLPSLKTMTRQTVLFEKISRPPAA